MLTSPRCMRAQPENPLVEGWNEAFGSRTLPLRRSGKLRVPRQTVLRYNLNQCGCAARLFAPVDGLMFASPSFPREVV